jgi:hypothetical protein
MAFYFQLFWLPTIASALLLVLVWVQGDLSERTPMIAAGWFLIALAAQYRATTTSVWALGLTAQTGLAIFLLVKQRLGRL